MTARLRVLPVYAGERGQHYLVLDNVGETPLRVDDVERMRAAAKDAGTVLVLRFPVDLPEVSSADPEGAALSGESVNLEYLPGEAHDNHAARRLAKELLDLVGESRDQATSVTVDAEGNVTVDKIDNSVDRNHYSVDYVSDFKHPEERVEAHPVGACSECASDAGHNAESRQEAPSEPDYGTQWERWLGMMAKYEAQISEAVPAVAEEPAEAAPTCTALYAPAMGSVAPCDGLTHGRGFHEGRAENGLSYRWELSRAERAELHEEEPAGLTITVDADMSSVNVGREVREALRQYERATVRRA